MFDPAHPLAIVLLALVLDAALGDPRWLYRALPHPVVLFGRLVSAGEAALNDLAVARRARLWRGGALALGLTAVAAGIGWTLQFGLGHLPGGWLVLALLASSLLAFRGLYDHVAAVAAALGRSLEEGRVAVSAIVGRDPESLDRAGVARAATESLAENFSDGVVAPVFWFALLGLPGLCAYKAVNTLDSMIGHRNERYEAFGKVAARLDDAVNWVPARLAGMLFVLAAALLPGAAAGQAWRTMWRDARKHKSPNAGWQEAALAGALGFALAGPRRYGDELVEDDWMGEGRSTLTTTDLRMALRLYLVAGSLIPVAIVSTWILGTAQS